MWRLDIEVKDKKIFRIKKRIPIWEEEEEKESDVNEDKGEEKERKKRKKI